MQDGDYIPGGGMMRIIPQGKEAGDDKLKDISGLTLASDEVFVFVLGVCVAHLTHALI